MYRQGSSERRVYALCTITAMFSTVVALRVYRSADQLGTLLAAVQDIYVAVKTSPIFLKGE